MLSIITGVIIIFGFGAISGVCGGIGFAYVMSKMIERKIKEYEKEE